MTLLYLAISAILFKKIRLIKYEKMCNFPTVSLGHIYTFMCLRFYSCTFQKRSNFQILCK